MAASDTVVITLEWAMLELFRHQRLQFELDASGERIEQIEGVLRRLVATWNCNSAALLAGQHNDCSPSLV